MEGIWKKISYEYSTTSVRLSRLDGWNHEIKPVVAEKSEFECGEKPKLINTFWSFRTIRILIQGSEKMIFQSSTPPQNENFSVDTLNKEVKSKVAEKHEFDNLVESILKAIYGIFGLSGFWKFILQLNPPQKVWSFRLRRWWKKSSQ